MSGWQSAVKFGLGSILLQCSCSCLRCVSRKGATTTQRWKCTVFYSVSYTRRGKSHLCIPFLGCVASVPISTVMSLWAIYIFLGLVHMFPYSRIGRPILEIYKTCPNQLKSPSQYNTTVWAPHNSMGSSLGRYVFGSVLSYNKAPPRLPGLGC